MTIRIGERRRIAFVSHNGSPRDNNERKGVFRSLPLPSAPGGVGGVGGVAAAFDAGTAARDGAIDNPKTPGLHYRDADCTKVRAPFADNRDSAKRILRR